MTVTPSPSKLWTQALYEHPGDPDARRARYQELMRQHSHIDAKETTMTDPHDERTARDVRYKCPACGGSNTYGGDPYPCSRCGYDGRIGSRMTRTKNEPVNTDTLNLHLHGETPMDSLTALEDRGPATVVRWIVLTHRMPHIDIQQVEWPSDGCLNGGYLTEREARQAACRKLERYIDDEKKERAALARRRWHLKRRIGEATSMLEELTHDA